MHNIHIAGYFLGIICLSFGCHSPNKQNGTQEMVLLLDSIYRNATPENYSYLNSQRAEMFRKQFLNPQVLDKFTTRKNYCQELLQAGNNVKAIEELEKLIQEVNPTGEIDFATKDLYNLLAIAYLRLGEQENCLLNHTTQSCIIPIQGSGVHQKPTGSRSAIRIYQKILQQFPDDLQAQWLLNIAYMTLGEYPSKVPTKYIIPEKVFASQYPLPRFEDVAGVVGVDVNERSGGCSLEDFNNDGFLDIVASSFGLQDQLRFFLNNGDGTFTDHTKEAGLQGIVGGLNMVHADYNNDGFEDVLLLRGAWLSQNGNHPNSLLKNNGDGTFEDVTRAAGVLTFQPSQTAAWGDFNNDGWLDLFVGNEYGPEHPYPSELYVNNQDGTFTNVAHELGMEINEFVKGCAWGDINNDGQLDLYISVLGGHNKLFLNKGGKSSKDWRFEDIAQKSGVAEPFFSFPTWFWDYDNDGWLDIFVCDYNNRRYGRVAYDVAADYLQQPHQGETPRLYRNKGDGTFADVTEQVGLDKVLYGMGANFGDFDSDGWLDCYIGTGDPSFMSVVPNRAFRNAEGKYFQDVTTAGGFGQIQKGHAVSFGDVDNDGDQDIYTVIGGFLEGDVYRNMLLENPGSDNAWVTLQLEGKRANRSAIGSRIKVTVLSRDGKQRTIHGTVSTGGSFGASSLQQEIGLGDAEKIVEVEIKWADDKGSISRFKNLMVNHKYKIVQGNDTPAVVPLNPVQLGKYKISHAHAH